MHIARDTIQFYANYKHYERAFSSVFSDNICSVIAHLLLKIMLIYLFCFPFAFERKLTVDEQKTKNENEKQIHI